MNPFPPVFGSEKWQTTAKTLKNPSIKRFCPQNPNIIFSYANKTIIDKI